ncbi:putative actin binding protein [Golovinomyces cichoracearum]|uniref:Putative actin binding protein n=1 Tax=Golovinomyces cichoracearum TaxID=62708 RepID=A0A420ISZ6_9PEZI|nr:putative actin binding protein [Golovinomyces cichoracearum]
MASLNTSINGPSIKSSYKSIIDGSLSTSFNSPTHGQWAIFSVSTPLINAFQPDRGGKESILKVQTTSEGELSEMIEEFSEGRIQFAFVKIKDLNTSLPKHILIGWCGEGVPERTKGYFTSHLAVISNIFHGYHVQITARSDRDLTPESIIKKVADASGSKYQQNNYISSTVCPPAPASKPVFSPSQFSGLSGPNILASSRLKANESNLNVDDDGWGTDAPQVTRSKLEKVAPAYKPTKVNMAELTKKNSASTQNDVDRTNENSDIVKGGYQPVGKVDIAAIRAQAQIKTDDRPTVVKGAYEPVGKVDIAAIRARAQKPAYSHISTTGSSVVNSSHNEQPLNSINQTERSAASSKSERLTTLPKPKVTNMFSSVHANFTGTKAPQPGSFGSEFTPTNLTKPMVSSTSKNFADEGGKTPAQLWQEKKARERSTSGASSVASNQRSQIINQTSTGGEWKSGYTGRSWAPVAINPTGLSDIGTTSDQGTGDQDHEQGTKSPPAGGISAIRNQFQAELPIRASMNQDSSNNLKSPPPPSINTSNRPNHVVSVPPPPPVRSLTPESPQREASPIRVAVPVARGKDLDSSASKTMDLSAREIEVDNTGVKLSNNSVPNTPDTAKVQTKNAPTGNLDPSNKGICALIQYDYEVAEDNEIQLIEGEFITNIDMVDDDWWMGVNSRGERGLFPSNYVELVEEISNTTAAQVSVTAIALYDYEAAEDNELSFEEDAVITNVEFPDEDWWHGSYNGKSGLFPANYVQLNE